MPKRFVLVARKPSIEPYGLHLLAEIPRQAGWKSEVILIDKDDFTPLYDLIGNRTSDTMVGIHIWAGYHKPLLREAKMLRSMGIPVVMGGPYATYSPERCLPYADWVVRASGFGFLGKILDGQLAPGVWFDPEARYEEHPIPQRDIIYDRYPEFAQSLIKSSLGAEGCPYGCFYCHAPEQAEMHGGFDNVKRRVGRVITEALIVLEHWPLKTMYFQDDVFAFDIKEWLPEFVRQWKEKVCVPFHCQLRLEMVRGPEGDKRLDLLAEAGCTGVTLAIESNSEFLRDHVLNRSMPDELIVEGCKKIMALGMTLRTEQIFAVPFSDIATDLGTVGLNVRIKPTMPWGSILSPYPGVPIGTMARNFGMWEGDYDDLEASFLDRSILRHIAGGPRDIQKIVERLPKDQRSKALLRMRVGAHNGGRDTDVFYQHIKHEKVGGKGPLVSVNVGDPERVGTVEYLSDAENEKYRDDTVFVQRLFNWLGRMPEGEQLGHSLVGLGHNERSWESIGQVTDAHLHKHLSHATLEGQVHALACEMRLDSPAELPEVVAQNPHYFTRFPAGGVLAETVADEGLFGPTLSTAESLDRLGAEARHHLFDYGLYRVKQGPEPIAK